MASKEQCTTDEFDPSQYTPLKDDDLQELITETVFEVSIDQTDDLIDRVLLPLNSEIVSNTEGVTIEDSNKFVDLEVSVSQGEAEVPLEETQIDSDLDPLCTADSSLQTNPPSHSHSCHEAVLEDSKSSPFLPTNPHLGSEPPLETNNETDSSVGGATGANPGEFPEGRNSPQGSSGDSPVGFDTRENTEDPPAASDTSKICPLLESCEESTVISTIPLETDNFFNAKNADVILNVSHLATSQQNSGENFTLSPSCPRVCPMDVSKDVESIDKDLFSSADKKTDGESNVSLDQSSEEKVVTGSLMHTPLNDEISNSRNINVTVEKVTVIDMGNFNSIINNNNNNNNNNDNDDETTVSDTTNTVPDPLKKTSDLVIDISRESKFPNASYKANEGENTNLYRQLNPTSEPLTLCNIKETDDAVFVDLSEDFMDNNPIPYITLVGSTDKKNEEVTRTPTDTDATLTDNERESREVEPKVTDTATNACAVPRSPSANIAEDIILNYETTSSNFISGNIVSLSNVLEEVDQTVQSALIEESPSSSAEDFKEVKFPPTRFGETGFIKQGDIGHCQCSSEKSEKATIQMHQSRSISMPTIPKLEKKDGEPRKTSLLCQRTLPTISERMAVEEDTPKTDDIELNFEFSLENSPMLRQSRRNKDARKHKDCRFLFAEELKEEEGEDSEDRFKCLRDSLDIAKLGKLSPAEDEDDDDDDESEIEDTLKPGETPPTMPPTKLKDSIKGTSPNENQIPHYPGNSQMALKKKKTSIKCEKGSASRRVSFPEDDSRLITSYLEPVNPWHYMHNVSTDAISDAYKKSCDRHHTRALPLLLQQIAALPVGHGERIECLSLRGNRLESGQCECLEEIFRRVQFHTLDFESCELEDDTAIPLFDMIEFYDSGIQLNVSSNTKIGNRGWHACARMLKRAPSLRLLEARNTNLNEQNMPILCKALRLGTRLHTLHLENCNLTGRPLVNLVGALRLNDTITDIYLADNRLGTNDCIQLGNLVRANKTLRVLDLRNNNIQDAGCTHICKDIAEQQSAQKTKAEEEKKPIVVGGSPGLKTLVLWNNHITVHAIPYFSIMLHANFALETLNLGRNNLTSEGILLLKNSLMRNRSLLRLGLQAARIGNEGAVALAECLADNTALSRIDLRENSIQVAGLLALSRSLKMNNTVVQLDLDANPRAEPSRELSEQHMALHQEIKSVCQRNQTNIHLKEVKEEEPRPEGEVPVKPSILDRRKISLTCEAPFYHMEVDTKPCTEGWTQGEGKRYWSPAPSPSVSPCPSPSISPSPSPVPSPLKNRFKVSKVAEQGGGGGGGSLSPTMGHSALSNTEQVLSTSAPAFFMHPTIGGSLPSLVPTTTRGNRFGGSGRRFTVTKVTENSTFKVGMPPNSRAMSSPNLIAPTVDESVTPTIVVSSPIKAVRGFSISDTEPTQTPQERPARPKPGMDRSSSLDLPDNHNRAQEDDDVFTSPEEGVPPKASPSKGTPQAEVIQRAPLASMEVGSLDSEGSEEDSSEITTQSSDSDEVRICTEGHSALPAWENHHKKTPMERRGCTETDLGRCALLNAAGKGGKMLGKQGAPRFPPDTDFAG